jgi:hypothetical protein
MIMITIVKKIQIISTVHNKVWNYKVFQYYEIQ